MKPFWSAITVGLSGGLGCFSNQSMPTQLGNRKSNEMNLRAALMVGWPLFTTKGDGRVVTRDPFIREFFSHLPIERFSAWRTS
jgi:hypothetical protein